MTRIKLELQISNLEDVNKLADCIFNVVSEEQFNKQEFKKQYIKLVKEKGMGPFCRIPKTQSGIEVIKNIIQEALTKSMIVQINTYMEK